MESSNVFISRSLKILNMLGDPSFEKEDQFQNSSFSKEIENSVEEEVLTENEVDAVNSVLEQVGNSDKFHPNSLDRVNESDADEPMLLDDNSDIDPTWAPNDSESDSEDCNDEAATTSNLSVSVISEPTSAAACPPDGVSAEGETEVRTKKRCRWQKGNPENWARNVAKKRRSECLPYTTKKGDQPAKTAQPINCGKCRFKCSVSFTEEDRTALCKHYWGLDYQRKKDFLLRNVEQTIPDRIKTNTISNKNRKCSRTYFFFKNEQKIRICQNFFLKTLSITDGPVIHAFKNVNAQGGFGLDDLRGKQAPVNRTPEVAVDRVLKHIQKFPVMESHYCRRSTSRLYLDSKLSISKLYELYCNECKESCVEPVSAITYRRIFCKNFNYSFFKPKKDQCLICTKYDTANCETKLNLQEEYLQHRERVKQSSEAKNIDKVRSNEDQKFVSATFDLQSVLQIPSTDTSQMYYLRKINMYNLCIYESKSPNDGHCFVWSELNGKRGSTEIGSALLNWVRQLPESVNHVTLYSDTCGGQNRNQHIAALFMYVVQNTKIDVLEHKFLESGHSYMEVDSMHSAIEKAKKNIPVYSMMDWMNIFRFARSTRKNKKAQPYKVKELMFTDMVDLTDLSANTIKNRNKDESGVTVSWLKVKCFKYEKSMPFVIQYRYDYSSPYSKIITNQVTRGRPLPITSFPKQLKPAYSKGFPITKEKKHDLEVMCRSGIIPEELHGWYLSLPVNGALKNRLPEPAVSEDESD